MSKLDDTVKRIFDAGYKCGRSDEKQGTGFTAILIGGILPLETKKQIKGIMLELIESCDSDNGNRPDLIFRSEVVRKVEAL